MITSPSKPRHRTVLTAILYAGLGALIIGAAVLVVGTFGLVDAIRDQQKTNTSINKTILDCSEPEGECSQRNRDEIAGAVNNIGKLSVYASACAADVDPTLPVRQRVATIERCVRELVEQPPPPR